MTIVNLNDTDHYDKQAKQNKQTEKQFMLTIVFGFGNKHKCF